MKKDGILNAELLRVIAAMGHTQTLVIADAGLPVPREVPCLDLSVVRGVPTFRELLDAVAGELVVEAATYASEADSVNPAVAGYIRGALPGVPVDAVPHEELKKKCAGAVAVIRTGECSSFSNVILRAGVNF